MNNPRLSLLISTLVVVPIALVVGAAGPAAAETPDSTFGSHVTLCAQMSTGFTRLHNPSHHRGAAPMDDMCGTQS